VSRFRFRLQRVLKLREDAERARATALASAQVDANDARDTRNHVADTRAAGQRTLQEASSAGNTVGTLQQMQFVLGAIDARLSIAESGVVTAESLVRHAQDELRSAFQAKHAVDMLRTKQELAHENAARQLDQLQMNEIALTRFHNADKSASDSERSTNG
jgi:flagellar export protein FliJ